MFCVYLCILHGCILRSTCVSVVLCLHFDGDLYVCIVVDAHCCIHDLVCLAVIPWLDSKVGASSSTTLTCDKWQ